MITDYKIVSGHNSVVLEDKVKMAMKEGWKPLGGASFVLEQAKGTSNRFHIIQTMIKDRPNTEVRTWI